MYILFEGIDTCGKSTQIDILKAKYPNIITTKEPGGTPFGLKAREILLDDTLESKRAELLLFLADRAEHYEQIIKPNIDKLIISDRGFVSGMAYALANEQSDIDTLIDLNRFALQDRLPDRVILFITDMTTLKQRSSEKELDGIELRGLEYLLRVQEQMRVVVEYMDIDHIIIDARDDMEQISNKIEESIYLQIESLESSLNIK